MCDRKIRDWKLGQTCSLMNLPSRNRPLHFSIHNNWTIQWIKKDQNASFRISKGSLKFDLCIEKFQKCTTVASSRFIIDFASCRNPKRKFFRRNRTRKTERRHKPGENVF